MGSDSDILSICLSIIFSEPWFRIIFFGLFTLNWSLWGLQKSEKIWYFLFFPGIPSTINSANYVMFICLERVLDLGHPDAVKVFCEQMLELHRGQAQWSEIENSIRKFNGSNPSHILLKKGRISCADELVDSISQGLRPNFR